MRKVFPLVGFHQMGDDELAIEAGAIKEAMTGNADFAQPSPPLSDVEADLDDYRLKLEIARRKGSPYDTTLKNQAKDKLAETMKQLGSYVNFVAKGDLALIQSAGFQPSSYGIQGVPSDPEGLKVINGELMGELIVRFNAVKTASLYQYRYAAVPESGQEPEWSNLFVTGQFKAQCDHRTDPWRGIPGGGTGAEPPWCQQLVPVCQATGTLTDR